MAEGEINPPKTDLTQTWDKNKLNFCQENIEALESTCDNKDEENRNENEEIKSELGDIFDYIFDRQEKIIIQYNI